MKILVAAVTILDGSDRFWRLIDEPSRESGGDGSWWRRQFIWLGFLRERWIKCERESCEKMKTQILEEWFLCMYPIFME